MADMKELADRIDPRKWEVFEPTSELVKVPRSQLIAASDSLREAAAMLTVLQSQVAVARKMAIEEAARVCGITYIANKKWRTEESDADKIAVLSAKNTAYDLAERIRSLSPTVDIDALTENASFDAFAAHRGGNREEAAKDWADWYSDDQKEVWRRTARAVLSAVGLK